MPTHQLLSQAGLPELSPEVQPSAGPFFGPCLRWRTTQVPGGCGSQKQESVHSGGGVVEVVSSPQSWAGSAPDGSDHTGRASCSTSRLYADSSSSPMRPMTVVSHSAHIPQIIPLICNNILYNMCTRGSLLRLFSSSGSASQSEEHDYQKLPSKISSTNVGKLNYWATVSLAWNYAEGACSMQVAYDNIVWPSLYSFIWILQLIELVFYKENVFLIRNSKTQMIISYVRDVTGTNLWSELKQR